MTAVGDSFPLRLGYLALVGDELSARAAGHARISAAEEPGEVA